MLVARGVVMIAVACVSLAACARQDLSGVYLAKVSDPTVMAYLTLTSTSPTSLVGNIAIAHVDGSASSGVTRVSYPLSATVNDGHVVFYSNGQQQTADLSGNGFTFAWPSDNGTIQTTRFEQTSTADINRLVAQINKHGTAARTAYMLTATATLELTNLSSGNSEFYVDDQPACSAPAGTHCTITVRVIDSHTLYATTSYGDGTYQTPVTALNARPNGSYRFEACGETGTPGQNCGLFTLFAGQ